MACGQQIVIKRPNHTHTSADIIDFTSAVDAIIGDMTGSTVISSFSANWNSVYYTVNSLSATWDAADVNVSGFVHLSGDVMTGSLSTPSISCDILYVGASTIYFLQNGIVVNSFNSQDVGLFRNTRTTVSANSGYWTSAYTTVNSNSAEWNYQGTDIKNLTSVWQDTYSTVNTNSSLWIPDTDITEVDTFVQNSSANINSIYSTVNLNSATWTGSTVSLPNSSYWDATYTQFSTQSANNLNVYSTVNSNSANWNYQGTDVKTLTSNWQNTYITVNSNSASWASSTISLPNSSNWDQTYTNFSTQSANNLNVYSTVNSNSSEWNYQGTDIKLLTGNYENVSNVVKTNSAQWATGDSTVNSFVQSTSSNINSVYTTVNSNSSDWNYQGTDIKNLTANWQDTYTNFSIQSAHNIVINTVVEQNSSVWSTTINSSAFYPSSGGILNGSLLTNTYISANSANLQSIQLDNNIANPSWVEGKVFYDSAEHTLAYYNDNSNMTVNVGQEEIVRVYNGESIQIDNGKVVYLSGSHGNKPRVFLANSSFGNSNTDKIIGVATTDIPATGNRLGYVTTFGIVHGVPVGNTVYTEGDNLYLTNNGNFSNVAPTKPDHNIDIGEVIGVSGSGSNYSIDILVNVIKKSTLDDLHNVIVSSASANDVLVYHSASGGYWVNHSSDDWENTYTRFSVQSANNLNVYTTVNSNSSDWNYRGTDIKSLTANWQNTYSTVNSNSSIWNAAEADPVFTTWANTNSANYQNTYTNFQSQSANNLKVYTTVNSNSSEWNYQGTDIKNLTGDWTNISTVVKANSAQWSIDTDNPEVNTFVQDNSANINSVYSTVNSNSANWVGGGTDVSSLTSNWELTYVTFGMQSANNVSVYSAYNANSSSYINTETDPVFNTWANTNSANYDSAYTTTNANSANWFQEISFNTNGTLQLSDSNSVAVSAMDAFSVSDNISITESNVSWKKYNEYKTMIPDAGLAYTDISPTTSSLVYCDVILSRLSARTMFRITINNDGSTCNYNISNLLNSDTQLFSAISVDNNAGFMRIGLTASVGTISAKFSVTCVS